MSSATELCYMPATALAAAVCAKELSPVEIVDAVLARITAVNPRLNAFTVVLDAAARAAAQRAETAVLSGEELGLLHGVPFLIKDLTLTAGIPTARGSKAYSGWLPDETGIPVERMVAAGGIFVGKTTTPEFGNKGITESPQTGVTNNPWNTGYTAGGSSGGSAAAVAAGLSPLAEGGDGAGSIRIPASCCGVVGLKPSFGRVPIYPHGGGFGLTMGGPITRTVADAALMLTAIAGDDDRDAYAVAERGIDFRPAVDRPSVRGFHVAYSRDLGMGPVDAQVTALTDAAARLFASTLGAEVAEVTPELPDAESIMLPIWHAQMGYNVERLILPRVQSPDDIDPTLFGMLAEGKQLGPFDFYAAAFVQRGAYYQAMRRFMANFDLLLTPTLKVPPFPHPGSAPGPSEIDGRPINRLLGWLLTYPFNLTGLPAITVPCGFSDAGLPVGLQIVGRRHADATVLHAAAAYEEAAPWANRRPACGE